MKRYGHLWQHIVDLDNLQAAHAAARTGKTNRRAVQRIDRNPERHAHDLAEHLHAGAYTTGEYTSRQMTERGKTRTIYRLPYWPEAMGRSAASYDGWTRFGSTPNLREQILEPWLETA